MILKEGEEVVSMGILTVCIKNLIEHSYSYSNASWSHLCIIMRLWSHQVTDYDLKDACNAVLFGKKKKPKPTNQTSKKKPNQKNTKKTENKVSESVNAALKNHSLSMAYPSPYNKEPSHVKVVAQLACC